MTRVALASVVVAMTGTSNVPAGKETFCPSTTETPLTLNTDSEVSDPVAALAAVAWIGRINRAAAAIKATSPRMRLIDELKALPSQES